MHCACSERENSAERDQRKHCIVQRACKRVESGERGERGRRNGVGGKASLQVALTIRQTMPLAISQPFVGQ